MKFFNKYKGKGSFGFKSCKDMAEAIRSNIQEADLESTIEKVELSKIGKEDTPDEIAGFFLNIFLKNSLV